MITVLSRNCQAHRSGISIFPSVGKAMNLDFRARCVDLKLIVTARLAARLQEDLEDVIVPRFAIVLIDIFV